MTEVDSTRIGKVNNSPPTVRCLHIHLCRRLWVSFSLMAHCCC